LPPERFQTHQPESHQPGTGTANNVAAKAFDSFFDQPCSVLSSSTLMCLTCYGTKNQDGQADRYSAATVKMKDKNLAGHVVNNCERGNEIHVDSDINSVAISKTVIFGWGSTNAKEPNSIALKDRKYPSDVRSRILLPGASATWVRRCTR
jgi:hypothetical protein